MSFIKYFTLLNYLRETRCLTAQHKFKR